MIHTHTHKEKTTVFYFICISIIIPKCQNALVFCFYYNFLLSRPSQKRNVIRETNYMVQKYKQRPTDKKEEEEED
jgi:hypothetical protein